MASEIHRRFELNVPGPSTRPAPAPHVAPPRTPHPICSLPSPTTTTTRISFDKPVTPDEIERACHAAEVCCLSALRYAGTDPAKVVRNRWDRSRW